MDYVSHKLNQLLVSFYHGFDNIYLGCVYCQPKDERLILVYNLVDTIELNMVGSVWRIQSIVVGSIRQQELATCIKKQS